MVLVIAACKINKKHKNNMGTMLSIGMAITTFWN
jgi:hypothetical protein